MMILIKNRILLRLVDYLTEVVNSIVVLHLGTAELKIFGAMKLAFYLSPIAVLITDLQIWYMDNSQYVAVVAWAIMIDYILGTIRHIFVDRDFDFRKNISGILRKGFLVVAVGYLFEGFNVIITHDSLISQYLEIVARLMVFLYPAGSAMGNSSVLSGGRFPPVGWMNRLNQFRQNADPKTFTNDYKPPTKPGAPPTMPL